METRFYNQDGTLTRYALACGYVELTDTGEKWVRLFWEGACYHVRAYDFAKHERIAWDTFTSLVDARRRFRVLSREVQPV